MHFLFGQMFFLGFSPFFTFLCFPIVLSLSSMNFHLFWFSLILCFWCCIFPNFWWFFCYFWCKKWKISYLDNKLTIFFNIILPFSLNNNTSFSMSIFYLFLGSCVSKLLTPPLIFHFLHLVFCWYLFHQIFFMSHK